jgi:putative transposase
MPDHIHILFRGIAYGADQRLAVSFLRRHLNTELSPFKLQREPYDHVLRQKDLERDAFHAVARYIADNPVRAGIAKAAAEYPYSGAVLPGRPRTNLHHPNFWDIFWEMHERLLLANGYEG